MAEEKEEPIVDNTSEGLKVKKKRGRPKKLVKPDEVIKVDLTKKEDNAVQEQGSNDSNATIKQPENEVNSEKVVDEVRESSANEASEQNQNEKQEEIASPLVEITDEEVKEPVEEETVIEQTIETTQQRELPENIEKLISFMEETGGTVEDYARLNADYSQVEEDVLLREYYKTTKPHLNSEEINFMLEDSFSWDEEEEEERAVRKKQLAYKEEIAKARKFLEDTKTKYYDEIKLRPSVTQEQKKAMDFFNRYNEEQQRAEKLHSDFVNRSKQLFTDFKGFNFNVGEKKFRYAVNNSDEVMNNQSKISNFVGKFLNKDGTIKDTEGYHRALYVANNSDAFAQHFYEQGKADAVRDINAKSKNINVENHNSNDEDIFIGGFKVRAINGEDSSRLKIKKPTKIN